jgi:hypothetical protein
MDLMIRQKRNLTLPSMICLTLIGSCWYVLSENTWQLINMSALRHPTDSFLWDVDIHVLRREIMVAPHEVTLADWWKLIEICLALRREKSSWEGCQRLSVQIALRHRQLVLRQQRALDFGWVLAQIGQLSARLNVRVQVIDEIKLQQLC